MKSRCQLCAMRALAEQVMTKPFTEELTLFVMREVERAAGFIAVPEAAEL